MKATSIEIKKELVTYENGRNYYSKKIDTYVYVIFENNASIRLCTLCSEIGNTFGWSEADKMKKSKSEKKIIQFINKYEDFVLTYIS